MPGWIYTRDGRCIEKGSAEHYAYLGEQPSGPAIFGDNEEFVSPIDGMLYRGKAEAREHNLKHDVINHRDLTGLPAGFCGKAPPLSTRERQQLRQDIVEAARSKGHLRGQ